MQTRLSLTCRNSVASASPNLTPEQPFISSSSPSYQPLPLSFCNNANASTWVGAECHLPACLSAGADSIFFPFAFRPTFFSASSAR